MLMRDSIDQNDLGKVAEEGSEDAQNEKDWPT